LLDPPERFGETLLGHVEDLAIENPGYW